MTVLKLNQPFIDDQPTLVVENKLAIGEHVIRLVVVDNDGQESDPLDWGLVVREGSVVPPVGPIPGQPPIVSPIPVPPIIRTVSPGSVTPSTEVTPERAPAAKPPRRRVGPKSTTAEPPKPARKTRRKSASKSTSEPDEQQSDATVKKKSTTKRSRRPRRDEQDT